jgi:hypothetical protein
VYERFLPTLQVIRQEARPQTLKGDQSNLGTAFSALFRRPQREAIPDLKPWELGSQSNDRIKYLDPGAIYRLVDSKINQITQKVLALLQLHTNTIQDVGEDFGGRWIF